MSKKLSFPKYQISNIWREFINTASKTILGSKETGSLSKNINSKIEEKINLCLSKSNDIIALRNHITELSFIYLSLNKQEKSFFFNYLYKKSKVDIKKTLHDLLIQHSNSSESELYTDIIKSLKYEWHIIFRQILCFYNGMDLLINMRQDLLRLIKVDPHLAIVESDLSNILSLWFENELLELEKITWDSPASLLEKLIKYEAVHKIKSWNDLQNRLSLDRLCFAFFHHKMPLDPIIFVEIALCNIIPRNINKILNIEEPTIDIKKASVAVFYSISNTKKGLSGINLGNFLIKRVLIDIQKNIPHIKVFCTLSPIINFSSWLDTALSNKNSILFSPSTNKKIQSLNINDDPKISLKTFINSDDWHLQEVPTIIEEVLTNLCIKYLTEVKENRKIDPVANFHLSNGAKLEQVNWLANDSDEAIKSSLGFMVNYLYEIDEVENNIKLHYEGETVCNKKIQKIVNTEKI